MKKLSTLILSTLFLFVLSSVYAQDSTTSAAKQINKTSEQADILYGKKMQQQSLSTKLFEKLDTSAAVKTKKKYYKKCSRKG